MTTLTGEIWQYMWNLVGRIQTTREEFQGITKNPVCSWLEYVIHNLSTIKNKINFREYSFQIITLS